MDDALLVRRFERLGDLPCDGECFVEGARTLCDALREVLALDEFHDEGRDPSGFLDRVDRRDVRMIQRGERLRLALKSGQAIRVRGEGVRQHFDRDLATEARIGGAVDRTHPALANLRGDLVDAETRARSEGQELDYMGEVTGGRDRSS